MAAPASGRSASGPESAGVSTCTAWGGMGWPRGRAPRLERVMNRMGGSRAITGLTLVAVWACGGDQQGPEPPGTAAPFEAVGGGNNVPDRFSSDLWVHGSYAYTGTWGSRVGGAGDVLCVGTVNPAGA